MGNLKGVLFSALALYTSTFGTLVFLPPLILLSFLDPRLGRKALDFMLWLWYVYCVALYEIICGVKIVITGEPAPEDDGTLIIMNHRTRFDWMFLFSYQLRCGSLNKLKISLKESLKFVPGPGWAMQIAGYMFLKRKWDADKHTIAKCISYFGRLRQKPQILLFPEGTNMSENTKQKSHNFAKCNGLEVYNYVLQPRTKGFTYFVQQMRQVACLDSVADVTIGYTENIPENESDILKGDFPREIHFHVKRYRGKDLPLNTEDLEMWCKDCWKRKEQTLKEFYESKKFGDRVKNGLQKDENRIQSLFRFALMFWTLFGIAVLWMLYYHPFFRWYCLGFTIVFISVSSNLTELCDYFMCRIKV